MPSVRSIEFRLTAWYAAALLVGFAALGLVMWFSVRYAVQHAVDDGLRRRMETLVGAVMEELEEEELEEDDPEELADEAEEELLEYAVGLPEAQLSQIRDEDDRQLFPFRGAEGALPWRRGGVNPELSTTEASGTSYRVLVQEVELAGRRYSILLGSSLDLLVDLRTRLVSVAALTFPLAVLAAAAGGLVMARRALRPVEAIADAAAGMTIQNLDRRIPTPGTSDAIERLARTFNDMLERLQASVLRIEQFSADASHELRTPLSVIRTTSELALRHGRTVEGYRSDLEDIESEAKRLGELIEVLLMLARDGGTGSVQMADVDLAAVASDVCRAFRPEARARELRLDLEPNENAVVTGNEASLRRMLSSLLENALAHTESGGITVAVHSDRAQIRLVVEDTGEGIPEDALPHIFERLYRVDASRSRRREGHLGLGLSIAKRIAELHDAELTVVSELGKGTRFTACFER